MRLLAWFEAHDDYEGRDVVARALVSMFLLGERRPLHREPVTLARSRLSLNQRLRSLAHPGSKREYQEDVEQHVLELSQRYLEDHRLAGQVVMQRCPGAENHWFSTSEASSSQASALVVPGGPARTVGTYSSNCSRPSKVRLAVISSETSGYPS